MQDKLYDLWLAANTYSIVVLGEFLVEGECNSDGVPDIPDGADVVELVTKFFKDME